jgi:hypothetical protein
MNMLVTSQYQPRVSSLTIFSLGGTANQIAVFRSNSIILLCPHSFLAHLTQRVSPLSSAVRPLTFHILINSSEATGPIWTKLWWNGPWMAPFQNGVRWSWLPTKMATKLKIEKRGDEILIVHCCFSIRQNELKF